MVAAEVLLLVTAFLPFFPSRLGFPAAEPFLGALQKGPVKFWRNALRSRKWLRAEKLRHQHQHHHHPPTTTRRGSSCSSWPWQRREKEEKDESKVSVPPEKHSPIP